jgi:1-acyl-sn-glycerol-3-phosphate acyltransferase
MQEIVSEEPYEFIPPVYHDFWPGVLRYLIRPYLRMHFGVHSVECRHVERLRESLDAGHSIMLAVNHCRLSDPMVLGCLAMEAGCYLFAMGSWHLFRHSWLQRFVSRRLGAFSVYREGNDRRAIDEAIKILTENKRPLVIFPEGAISRHNDLIMELMDGPSVIARQAAKRREKQNPPGKVVIHPIAIRYSFLGDLDASLGPILDSLEARLTWSPQRHLSLTQRIGRLGEALLSLKEVEYLGTVRSGAPYDRAQQLIETVLLRLEEKWKIEDREDGVVARVKSLRAAILPDLVAKKITPDERQERWRDLSACYYVQQISHYPRDYIHREKNYPERVVETVERFEEDLTDKIKKVEPFHATIQVGEAIPVSTRRERGTVGDPITAQIRKQIQGMVDQLAAERPLV